jgi:DNA modification methylase
MHIALVPVDRVVPYARNPRKNQGAVAKVAASLKEFGWRQPIVVDSEMVVIAGHTRLMAARQLGMAEVPVHVADGLTPSQVKAYRLADNRVGEEAEWDFDLLKLEIGDLDGDGYDLDLLGFDADELAKALADPNAGLTDPDEVPEPPAIPVSVLGDVWIMGKHRVMCGDSTSVDAFAKLMDGKQADFCFTSPPYNSAMKGGGRMGANEGKGFYADGYNDNKSSDEYLDFNMAIFAAMASVASKDFTCCYNINYNKNSPSEYLDVAYHAKRVMPLVETIVWEKQMAVSLQGDNLTRIYEFVFVFCNGKFKINKNRTECLKNLWKVSNIGANHESHKACFPVALVEMGIQYFAPHGANIVEPFGGSGTTLIAAEKLGCNAHLMELDPRYVDVAVTRWQTFTGQTATLEGDGRSFDELSAERKSA